jgi:hypothetical protein
MWDTMSRDGEKYCPALVTYASARGCIVGVVQSRQQWWGRLLFDATKIMLWAPRSLVCFDCGFESACARDWRHKLTFAFQASDVLCILLCARSITCTIQTAISRSHVGAHTALCNGRPFCRSLPDILRVRKYAHSENNLPILGSCNLQK